MTTKIIDSPTEADYFVHSRKLIERIVIEADLELVTPAHFGNGREGEAVDMLLLVDPRDGRTPLLTGATLAGALRSYLKDCLPEREKKPSLVQLLFGGERRTEDGDQSCLIIDDAFGVPGTFQIEVREGVKIDPVTRTAAGKFLFNRELWSAGTQFKLRFELLIDEGNQHTGLLPALATALQGLTNGEITLGARKTRGLGQVQINEWRMRDYALTEPGQLLDWLRFGNMPLDVTDENVQHGSDLVAVVGNPFPSSRQTFTIDAFFEIDTSLLIRSGGRDVNEPEMVYLGKERRDQRPILSGTSVAGALRARAGRIVRTLSGESEIRRDAKGNFLDPQIIKAIFGTMETKTERCASRLRIEEHLIKGAETDLIQNRVSIDRFTGGALDGALFNQQPVFGKPGSLVHLKMSLSNPKPHEIGLLMLLLKDLWTGDLALGGESSVGRGRLRGQKADVTTYTDRWSIVQDDQKLDVSGDKANLESCVSALLETLRGQSES